MVDYTAVVYTDAGAFETAVKAVANTVRIYPLAFMVNGKQKFMLITGGAFI